MEQKFSIFGVNYQNGPCPKLKHENKDQNYKKGFDFGLKGGNQNAQGLFCNLLQYLYCIEVAV